MRDVALRVLQAPPDHLIGVGAARREALLERAARRRQDENAMRRRHTRAHLARALPVDLEQQALARRQRFRTAARPVP